MSASRFEVDATHRRVLRSTPGTYAALGDDHLREHDAWRRRQQTLLSSSKPSRADTRAIRATVDELSDTLLEITGLLSVRYGTPDLGNKADPVDELVYIILSRRTREGAYQTAYQALKSRYSTWEDLASADLEDVETLIASSGLGRRKAQSLQLALLGLIAEFGRCTLDPIRSWTDDAVAAFLSSLPAIGPKSAACVMMCSLDRPAFPVDANVGRVLERLGTLRLLGVELVGTGHKEKQRLLWDAIPPVLRYPLHVNALVHGRAVCLPRRPRCMECVLVERCNFAGRLAQTHDGSGRSTD